MNGNNLIDVEDVLYPSDNLYDIPCLRLDRQAGMLKLPLSPYGLGRKTKEASTIHFMSMIIGLKVYGKILQKYWRGMPLRSLNRIFRYLIPHHCLMVFISSTRSGG